MRHNGSLKLHSTGEKFELMKYCTQGFLTQLYIITHSFNISYHLFRYRCARNLKKKYVTYFSENQTMQLWFTSTYSTLQLWHFHGLLHASIAWTRNIPICYYRQVYIWIKISRCFFTFQKFSVVYTAVLTIADVWFIKKNRSIV